MAVLPALAPGVAEVTPTAPVVNRRPQRAPRSVPREALIYTRREHAALPRLDAAFREMYTIGLPELDAGERFTLGVTSAVRGEGRTTTALGLALAVARDLDVDTLIVELDLEHPTLARELHLPEDRGLTSVLLDNVRLEAVLQQLDASSVDVLPAGPAPFAASRLLRSAGLRELLAALRTMYHVVILDLPPALGSSDIVPLSTLTDGVLLVARGGVTPVRLVEQATARLPEGKVRGVVLSGQRSRIPNWLRRRL